MSVVTFYVLETPLPDGVRIEIAEGEKAVMGAAQIKCIVWDSNWAALGNKRALMLPSFGWNLGTTPWAIWMFELWIDPSAPGREPILIYS